MPRFPYHLATNQFHPDFHLLHACPHLDLPHRCTNKSECEIQASNSLFGNPCPDSSKYLEVHYRCISYSDNGLSKYPRSKLELLTNSRNFRLGTNSNFKFWNSRPEKSSMKIKWKSLTNRFSSILKTHQTLMIKAFGRMLLIGKRISTGGSLKWLTKGWFFMHYALLKSKASLLRKWFKRLIVQLVQLTEHCLSGCHPVKSLYWTLKPLKK